MSTAPASTIRCCAADASAANTSKLSVTFDHGALDEQTVDAGRLLQRLAQPAAGIGIELERDGAEVEIEIDERHSLAALLGKQPGAGNGCCRRADAAAAADKDDHLPQPAAGPRSSVSRPFLQGSRQGLTGRRFDDVVVGAGCEQIAEQSNIVDDTQRDELQLGAADRSSRVDLGDRSG